MAEAEPSREFSPQEAHGLLSLAPTLEALGKLKHNFATLIDEKYHAARMATAGAILALVAACGQAESNVKVSPAEPGYQPTAPHQSIEALPSTQTPIIDSRQQPVLTPVKTQNPATRESSPITETPPPTPQTTLEALPTQTQEPPTPTPTPTPEPTPTATPTPEKPKSSWVIEVDPKLSQISAEILEADKTIIRSVIDKFPQIGNLKIIMTSGPVSTFDPETQTIILARNYERFVKAPESFRWSVAHEIGHYLDPELNGQALSAFLTETQLDELKQLREQALSDPFWGRNYPDLEKIFTRKSGVSNALNLSKTYTDEQLAAWSNLYADALWLGRYTPFRPYVYKQLKEIEKYAREATDISDVQSILDFLKKPDVAAKLEPLAAQNPLFAKALELIKTKKDLFTAENTVWPALAPTPVHLQGKYTADYWKALPLYIEMVMTEAYLEGDQNFMAIFRFGDDEDRERVDYTLAAKRENADSEKFPDLGAVTRMLGVRTSLSPFFERLSEFQER